MGSLTKYKQWVKTLPCSYCGKPSDDPHHIKGVGGFSGMSLTACDLFVMPVCRPCHNALHAGDKDMRDTQWLHVMRTIETAHRTGRINVSRS